MDIRIGHLNILDHLLLAPAESGNILTGGMAPRVLDRMYLQPLNAWEQVAQGLASGDINGAFISIPMAMAIFSQRRDIALVMFTHRGGSRMAAGRGIRQFKDFKGKSVLVPHPLSIQNMLLHRFLDGRNLTPQTADTGLTPPGSGVLTETVPPLLMPEMMERDTGDIAALLCEDPFCTSAIQKGCAAPLLTTNDLWPEHPGSGFVVHRSLMEARRGEIQELATLLFQRAVILESVVESVKTQGSPAPHAGTAAAAKFLNQPESLVRRSLEESGITFAPELLVPDKALLEIIARYMGETMAVLPDPIQLDDFIDSEFARRALEETC